MSQIERYISPQLLLNAGLSIGMACIVYFCSTGMLVGTMAIALIPIGLYYFAQCIYHPIVSFIGLFITNYLIMAIMRYTYTAGLSPLVDIMLVNSLFVTFIHSALKKDLQWRSGFNVLTIGLFGWMIYCLFQIINPTALTEAWISSRSLIYHGVLTSILAGLILNKYSYIKKLLFVFSILSLIAIFKGMMQKYIGFDNGESAWLAAGAAKMHLIGSGNRYFSIFSDAGSYGSIMGLAGVVLFITAFYTSKVKMKIYYTIVATLSIYGLFLSGTRGAMAVPLGGLMLFCLLSKQVKLMAITGALGFFIYVFFAFTTIGQGNAQIRRMRTAFSPTEDASFSIRLDNQKKLAKYLRNRPFGEGLGLGGVEAQRFGERTTSLIPHDSAYVKIWMETGVVGLILYLSIFIGSLLWGCYVAMFRVKHNRLRGLITAMLCGVFGMMISAYGNAFFNQYPSQIIVITFLTIAVNGERIDKYISKKEDTKTIIKTI